MALVVMSLSLQWYADSNELENQVIYIGLLYYIGWIELFWHFVCSLHVSIEMTALLN